VQGSSDLMRKNCDLVSLPAQILFCLFLGRVKTNFFVFRTLYVGLSRFRLLFGLCEMSVHLTELPYVMREAAMVISKSTSPILCSAYGVFLPTSVLSCV